MDDGLINALTPLVSLANEYMYRNGTIKHESGPKRLNELLDELAQELLGKTTKITWALRNRGVDTCHKCGVWECREQLIQDYAGLCKFCKEEG